MAALINLKGIGPRCQALLNQVGIFTAEELREVGAIEAYLRIIEETEFSAHIALLYALVGAVEDRHWQEVAQTEKVRLRAELEGLQELRN